MDRLNVVPDVALVVVTPLAERAGEDGGVPPVLLQPVQLDDSLVADLVVPQQGVSGEAALRGFWLLLSTHWRHLMNDDSATVATGQ